MPPTGLVRQYSNISSIIEQYHVTIEGEAYDSTASGEGEYRHTVFCQARHITAYREC